MPEPQDPFFCPGVTVAPAACPLLTHPVTGSAVERLAEAVLSRPDADSDFLLLTAEALQEVILEAPSDSDTRRLGVLRDRLRLRSVAVTRGAKGQAQAAALLKVLPASSASLRMWRASMSHSCAAWGWTPILDALIAAAEELEHQPRRIA